MGYPLMLTPVIAALLGWLLTWFLIRSLFRPRLPRRGLGFPIQGMIPKRQPEFASKIGELAGPEMFLSKVIENKILDPSTLEKITPEIETHIDYFLRVKLKDAMPMVAMFVGDKTISQMKEVFMTEMKTLFPEIMKSYVNELQKDSNLRRKITEKLTTLPSSEIESFFLQTFRKEIRYVKIAGALLGFIIGVLQLIIILLIRS